VEQKGREEASGRQSSSRIIPSFTSEKNQSIALTRPYLLPWLTLLYLFTIEYGQSIAASIALRASRIHNESPELASRGPSHAKNKFNGQKGLILSITSRAAE
jgi:hypothetical protein